MDSGRSLFQLQIPEMDAEILGTRPEKQKAVPVYHSTSKVSNAKPENILLYQHTSHTQRLHTYLPVNRRPVGKSFSEVVAVLFHRVRATFSHVLSFSHCF